MSDRGHATRERLSVCHRRFSRESFLNASNAGPQVQPRVSRTGIAVSAGQEVRRDSRTRIRLDCIMKADARTPRAPRAPPRTVLLIDDEPRVLNVLVQLFALRGWNAIRAPDGRTGVTLYEQSRPLLFSKSSSLMGLDDFSSAGYFRDR